MNVVMPQVAEHKITCSGCKHFANGNSERFGNLLGGVISADVCMVNQRVISNPSVSIKDNIEMQNKIADKCSYFDPLLPNSEDVYSESTNGDVHIISLGIPTIGSNPDKPLGNDNKPYSCSNCIYISSRTDIHTDNTVPNTTLNVCKRFGYTIKVGAGEQVAQGCGFGIAAFSEQDTEANKVSLSLEPFPDLIPEEKDIVVDINTEDPLNYQSDSPVSEEDAKAGIKAWRKVVDGNRSVMIPIFNPDFFSENERSKIPRPGDDEHPELYIDYHNIMYKFASIWMMTETPNLIGFAGVGKSEAYRHAAYLMQLPFERISITNSTELDDLAGHAQYSKENGTYFEYGRIPKAWRKPCVILIDEPNVGPPDVWQFLRPLTDNSKQLVLDINKGERISRNKYCFMGMAMNPAWDVRNVGTHEISDADGRRLWHIFVPLPEESVEKEIIFKHCKTDGYDLRPVTYRMIKKIGDDIRKFCEEDVLPIQWGIAQQIKVARGTKYFTIEECYKLAVADLLDPDSAEAIMAIVKGHTGGGDKNSFREKGTR